MAQTLGLGPVNLVVSMKILTLIAMLLCGLMFSFNVFTAVSQVRVPQTTAMLGVDKVSDIIQIRNSYAGVAYVQATVVEVFIDENGLESHHTITGADKADAIVALPEKFIISPKGSSSVRLLYTGKTAPTEDRYFKIRFTPIIKSEFYSDADQTGVESSVFISITTTTFAAVIKGEPKPELDIKTGDNQATVTNVGDSMILLNDCKVCVGSVCEISSQKRLINNRSVTFDFNTQQLDMQSLGYLTCSTLSTTELGQLEQVIPYSQPDLLDEF